MATESEGIEKGAILLLSLGKDEAAEVLKNLGPKEVQKLGHAMAGLKQVARERVESVIDEFTEQTSKGSPVSVDSETIKAMLTKALGDDRAASLISRIMSGNDTAGIEGLKWMDAASVADLIRNEHPQIIATILVYLEFDHAGDILKQFTDRLRNDVLLRIATLDGVQPTALRELNGALTRILSNASGNIKKTAMGGIRHAAEILNFVGQTNETAIIDNVREYDPDLAQKILDEMFIFENLVDIDDRGIQLLLRELQSDALIIELKGASPELRENMIETLQAMAIDLDRFLEDDPPLDLLRRYRNGERNVFARRLDSILGREQTERIGRKYREDGEFKETVDRYVQQFETLMEQTARSDRENVLVETYLTSQTGKVYVALASAIGRLA